MDDSLKETEQPDALNGALVGSEFVRVNDTISVRRLDEGDLDEAIKLTREWVKVELADPEIVRTIVRNNPDAFWGIFRQTDVDIPPRLVGYYSFLLLNEQGAKDLFSRALDARNPRLDQLAKSGERPEVIYIWVMIASGLTTVAGPTIAKLMEYLHAGRPICATAATHAGLNRLRSLRYKPVTPEDDGLGGLFILKRYSTAAEASARAARLKRRTERFKIIVVSTAEEAAQMRAVRAATYIAEQNCPYGEEFDGNDYTCTHILGLIDGEPAATLRIRYFADFVKFERLAVLSRFRRTLIAPEIVKFALRLCGRKGYRKGYGQAQKRFVQFWEHLGFETLPKTQRVVYSDHEYVEMWGTILPNGDPITMDSDPYLLVRPEGRWDELGILERSAERPATNPH
ncbi:MAG TPA: hypothetical protein VGG48_02010 [Rhizomicrobium sp.]|jgi:predicted GNAT family N-acyltransferase